MSIGQSSVAPPVMFVRESEVTNRVVAVGQGSVAPVVVAVLPLLPLGH